MANVQLGCLLGKLSTLLVPTCTPLSARSAAFSDPAQTVLSSLSIPSQLPTRAPLLVSLYAAPSRHPLDTFLCHSPLSGQLPIEFYTQQWLLEISVQGELGFLCTTEAGVLFYSPPSLIPSLSLVCSFFCLFSVALCLLCCWQTVYYFVDKCVFKLDSPRDGAGTGAGG